MKKLLIAAYFGRLPNWIGLFLRSCRENPGWNWLIFTDDHAPRALPPNVHLHYCTLEWVRALAEQKLGLPVTLPKPYKLCDLRPAYGRIFEEFTQGCDFWGHCDLDMVWGQLDDWFPEERIARLDRVQRYGQFSLCRNDPRVNHLYLAHPRHRFIFGDDNNFIFDETRTWEMIYAQAGLRFASERSFADMDRHSRRAILSHIDRSPAAAEIFGWKAGRVWRYFSGDGTAGRKEAREYPYLHFSRRALAIPDFDPATVAGWYFLPDRVIEDTGADPLELARRYNSAPAGGEWLYFHTTKLQRWLNAWSRMGRIGCHFAAYALRQSFASAAAPKELPNHVPPA